MELAVRDNVIFQMKLELENRKRILCAKRKQLKHITSENTILNGVLADYDKYNKYIIKQKQDQILFLNMLHEYITNITTDINITNSQLNESKIEQREILNEINILKSELNELSNDI